MSTVLKLELQQFGKPAPTAVATEISGDGPSGLTLAYLELDACETSDREAASIGDALETYARPNRAHASKRMRQPLDRIASLAAGVLVDVIAAPLFREGRAPIAVSRSGKPDFEAGAHFSLSHSRSAVCCAVAEQPVGVDVEPIVRDYEDIRALCLTESESDYIDIRPNHEDRARAFTQIWTRKEALGKWLGCGLRNSVLRTDMLRWPNGCERVLCSQLLGLPPSQAPLVSTFNAQGACVSVCGTGSVHIVTVTLAELITAASTLSAASWKGPRK